jgi:hypothetical protein
VKARSKARMKKRGDRFVVGYLGARNMVFSRARDLASSSFNNTRSTEPMTKRQAAKLLDEMPCADCAIFELVPVKVNR